MELSENELRDYLFEKHNNSISELIHGKREPFEWKGEGFPPISIFSGRLEGKIALITGAARGIDDAIAMVFAAEGAFVYVTDIDQDNGVACCPVPRSFHFIRASRRSWRENVA